MNRGYRELLEEGSGTVLLTSEEAVFYFSGFYTTAKRPKQIGYTAVVLSGHEKKLLVPEKWRLQAEQTAVCVSLATYRNTETAYREKIAELLKTEDCSNVWVEYENIPLAVYLKIRPGAGEILDITPRLNALRAVKTPDEIIKLRAAAHLAAKAMEAVPKLLKYQMTEREAAAELEYHMRKAGSDGVPFTMKALSGENSGIVTAVPGDRRLGKGDLLLLDFGARYQGYASDWTRTFCLGEANAQQEELYRLVWNIQRECIRMIRPKLPLCKLLERAAEIAAEHPMGKYFQQYLGHSVGISSQEYPPIEPGSGFVIEKDMVLTVEPGIYIPGFGGVRIEDEVLVTEQGCEILTGLKEEKFVIRLL